MGISATGRQRPRSGLGPFAGLCLLVPLGLAHCTSEHAMANPEPSDAISGELVTYVADFEDGHSERWHSLRTPDGQSIRLSFADEPAVQPGTKIRVWGESFGAAMRVGRF